MRSSEPVYDEHGDLLGFVEQTVREVPTVRYIPYGMANDLSKEKLPLERTKTAAIQAVREWHKT